MTPSVTTGSSAASRTKPDNVARIHRLASAMNRSTINTSAMPAPNTISGASA